MRFLILLLASIFLTGAAMTPAEKQAAETKAAQAAEKRAVAAEEKKAGKAKGEEKVKGTPGKKKLGEGKPGT